MNIIDTGKLLYVKTYIDNCTEVHLFYPVNKREIAGKKYAGLNWEYYAIMLTIAHLLYSGQKYPNYLFTWNYSNNIVGIY